MQKYLTGVIALLLTVVASHGRADNFERPMKGNHRVDFCLHFARDCGQPAADEFCYQQGFHAGAASWSVEREQITSSITLGDSAVCEPTVHNCDAFSRIDCHGSRFVNPLHSSGLPLDLCYEFESRCGADAAHAFCRQNRYSRALGWRVQRSVDRSQTIGSNAICDSRSHNCDSFASIDCY